MQRTILQGFAAQRTILQGFAVQRRWVTRLFVLRVGLPMQSSWRRDGMYTDDCCI